MEAVVLQDLGSVVYFQVILKNETYYSVAQKSDRLHYFIL